MSEHAITVQGILRGLDILIDGLKALDHLLKPFRQAYRSGEELVLQHGLSRVTQPD
jgi:hypothetical protein